MSGNTVLTRFDALFRSWITIKSELDIWLEDIDVGLGEEQIYEQLKSIQVDLLNLIKQPEQDSLELSADQVSNFRRMYFALAAYLDDFLLQRYAWPGLSEENKIIARKIWLKLLIERALFGTRSAGRAFPKAVQELNCLGRYSESDLSLLNVYVRILWLGFGPNTSETKVFHSTLRDEAISVLRLNQKDTDESFSRLSLGWMPPPGRKVERLAPIARWKNLFFKTGLGVIAISLILWLVLSYFIEELLK